MFERSFKKRKKENIFEFFAFEEKSTISLSRIHRYSNFRYWKETRSFDTFDLILKENGIIYSRSTHGIYARLEALDSKIPSTRTVFNPNPPLQGSCDRKQMQISSQLAAIQLSFII